MNVVITARLVGLYLLATFYLPHLSHVLKFTTHLDEKDLYIL